MTGTISVRSHLHRDERVQVLLILTQLEQFTVLGTLLSLWSHGDFNSREAIDVYAGFSGFADSMEQAGLLVENSHGLAFVSGNLYTFGGAE